MRHNEPLDLTKEFSGCAKCGATARMLFYEITKDDVEGHECPKKRMKLSDVLIAILVWSSIFGLIVSFVLLGVYLHTFI